MEREARKRVITELMNCSNRLCRPNNRAKGKHDKEQNHEQVSARYHMVKAAE